ncbi:MAG: acyl carrier protein [Clostridia bacterium]|nr:acyl carrier protein [Clostridia bacterium]
MSTMIEQIQQKVIDYWRQVLDDPDVEIGPDSNLIDDLALSSLEIFVSLMDMERNYGIRIPERCLRRMTTPRGAAEVIAQSLSQKGDAHEPRQ